MAFAVYDHTPLVGYIAWEDLHIQYMGTSYPIDDGYTAQRFVWWDPAISTTSLQAGSTLPTLSDDGLLVFLNKDGVHVTVPKSTVVEGSLIVEESILTNALAANVVTTNKIAAGAIISEKIGAHEVLAVNLAAGAVEADKIAANAVTTGKLDAGAVTADKIATNAVTADKINANAVTSVKINAGAVTADKIQANAVTASKLASITMEVGKHLQSSNYDGTDVSTGDATSGFRLEAGGKAEFSDVRVRGEITASEFHGVPTVNLLANGNFETNTSGWTANTADLPLSTIARDTSQAHSGSASLRVQASSAGFAAAYTEVPVQPGDIIHMTAWVKKGTLHAAPNKGRNDVHVTMDFYNGATLIMANGGTPFQVGTSWQFIERYVAVPANLTNVTHVRVGYSSYASSGSALFIDDVVVGKAPMMEIPYVVTNEDDSHLRSLILPDTVGFAAPHSSYPYGMVAREAGEGLPMLDVQGPSLGPSYASLRLGLDDTGGTMLAGLADSILLNGDIQTEWGRRFWPPYYCRASTSSSLNLSNNSPTLVTGFAGNWDDPFGMTITNSVVLPGDSSEMWLVFVTVHCTFAGNGSGRRILGVGYDGNASSVSADTRPVTQANPAGNTSPMYLGYTDIQVKPGGTQINMAAFQDSGGTLAVTHRSLMVLALPVPW